PARAAKAHRQRSRRGNLLVVGGPQSDRCRVEDLPGVPQDTRRAPRGSDPGFVVGDPEQPRLLAGALTCGQFGISVATGCSGGYYLRGVIETPYRPPQPKGSNRRMRVLQHLFE